MGHWWAILGHIWAILGNFWPFLGHFVAFLDKFAESSNFFAAPLGSRDSLLECMLPDITGHLLTLLFWTMSVLLEQGVLQKLGDSYPLPINTKQFHEIIILYVEYSTRKAILKVAFPPFFRNLGGRSHSIRYIIVKL